MLTVDREPTGNERAAGARADKRARRLDRDAGLRRCAASAGIAVVALSLLIATELARAQGADVSAERAASSELTAVDYDFVAQANLGAPFQIDSSRVAETCATTSAIRDYAHSMVVTQSPIADGLKKILQERHIKAPSNTLLYGAYHAMIASLKAEQGAALDRDYVEGQVEFQKGNAALFRNETKRGYDTRLKEFARATLPKIEDHLRQALALARVNEPGKAAPE